MSYIQIVKELKAAADPERAQNSMWFFKTAKGEYGAHDFFIGVTVPVQRAVAKRFSDTSLRDIQKLLKSNVHEHRLTALFILVSQYHKAPDVQQQKVLVDFYLKHIRQVNNWDLVDSSAHKILGAWLVHQRNRKILYRLAQSQNLWERRIAIISTFAFIDRGDLRDAFKLAQLLLKDTHDLIHKAVGWVLREAGKKDRKRLEQFLDAHVAHMPRTMLRYAIEKFPEKRRLYYLKK